MLEQALERHYIIVEADLHAHIELEELTLTRYLTAVRQQQYEEGKITREQAEQYAKRRATARTRKQHEAQLQKLEQARLAQKPVAITIIVDWKESVVWGANPVATVVTIPSGKVTTGTASGSGYDKTSVAVARALNQQPGIMKALYKLKERGLRQHKHPKDKSNERLLGYGIGYGPLPAFQGGVGVGRYMATLQRCGYTVQTTPCNKNRTIYTLHTRKHN